MASAEEARAWLDAFRQATYGPGSYPHMAFPIDKDMDKDLSDKEENGEPSSLIRHQSTNRRPSTSKDDSEPAV